ncbi:MAG: hypothetical protein IMZ71_05690 [Chloroflexi bacterium]|nr:hypothetical protein [Chloroflexota bacterium]
MELFANVIPKQKIPIPWGWKNRKTPSGLFVVTNPGAIRMPQLCKYFDWSEFVVEDMAKGRPFGTRNMKSVFTTATRFMGWEELLIQRPPLDEITRGFLEWNARLCEAWDGRLEWFMLGDDIAYNRGLLIRPDWWREWVKPEYVKLVEFARRRAMKVVFHSDGDLFDVLDDFAEMGVDALNYQPIGRMRGLGGEWEGMALIRNESADRSNENMMGLQPRETTP